MDSSSIFTYAAMMITSALGIVGQSTNTRDHAGKLTRWGKASIIGIVASTTAGLIAYGADQAAKAKETATLTSKIEETRHSVAPLLAPIDGSTITATFQLPCSDPQYKSACSAPDARTALSLLSTAAGPVISFKAYDPVLMQQTHKISLRGTVRFDLSKALAWKAQAFSGADFAEWLVVRVYSSPIELEFSDSTIIGMQDFVGKTIELTTMANPLGPWLESYSLKTPRGQFVAASRPGLRRISQGEVVTWSVNILGQGASSTHL